MSVVDFHAHLTPERFKKSIRETGSWYGLGPEAGELHRAGFIKTLPERLADMDANGIDMQLISPTVGFYRYEDDVDRTLRIHQECNDEIGEIAREHPERFKGLGHVPMQDIDTAVSEMDRIVTKVGLSGVIVRDHVNGKTYDEPQFRRFFAAAEDLGAIVFFHQGGGTLVNQRTHKYKLGNAIGNLTERALTFACLVFGGVMDAFPALKVLLAHGGGYAPYGVGRMDKVAGAKEGEFPNSGLQPPFAAEAEPGQFELQVPPSEYLGRFLYDCCTYDEPALRFLIDRVGIENVVLGTDYPAPMELKDPVSWVRGLGSLKSTERDAILTGNARRLLFD